jgi:hypothetical protein
MFHISFTKADLIRAAWSFLGGALAYLGLVQADIVSGNADWDAVVYGAVVAGLVSIKNLVLKDGTTLKG